ncbi:GPI mannosyltransferase 2-like [Stegodyphus dumicola]|uniref:GPI mannosyltransferase 2-like n=1 Tax=Stegodyphus dumicola TaxID=202533 RepID=UPI0015AA0F01|nr:GPI mannosyltransferase 2-like [Stegodyphus dumicola]
MFTHVLFNVVIPDHKADAFRLPYRVEPGVGNVIVSNLLGGFSRWDAQYFMHITLYGYTHENTLAFFPLFPLFLKWLSCLISFIFPSFFSSLNCVLLVGTLLNCILFSIAAVFLFKLTHTVFHSELFAFTSIFLFCINPASVFFSALYSESLFSFFTFSGLWALEKNKIFWALISLTLSVGVRSNGVLSVGYLIYVILKEYLYLNFLDQQTFRARIILFFKTAVKLLLYVFIFILPFFAYQLYCYWLFCVSDFSEVELPDIVVEFLIRNDLKLPSEPSKWCFWNIPLAYSYVQSRYWNVGFLTYHTVVQIPNFLLAAPILILMIFSSIKYFNKNRRFLWHAGLLVMENDDLTDIYNCTRCFPYFLHVFTLTIFCVLFIHVQVTTRILCSATPIVYWISAMAVLPNSERARMKLMKDYKDYSYQGFLAANMHFIKKIYMHSTFYGKFIFWYFMCYFFIGISLHVNFFPWT